MYQQFVFHMFIMAEISHFENLYWTESSLAPVKLLEAQLDIRIEFDPYPAEKRGERVRERGGNPAEATSLQQHGFRAPFPLRLPSSDGQGGPLRSFY